MADITIQKSGDTTNRSTFLMLEPETLVQTLFDAIENNWSDNALELIIKELTKKEHNYKDLLQSVENRFGKPVALKIIRIVYNQ